MFSMFTVFIYLFVCLVCLFVYLFIYLFDIKTLVRSYSSQQYLSNKSSFVMLSKDVSDLYTKYLRTVNFLSS